MMIRRMTGLPLLLFLAALIYVPVITSSADTIDTGTVNLTIEKWCEVTILDDIQITVTSSDIGIGLPKADSSDVSVLTNMNTTLRCPTSVYLEKDGVPAAFTNYVDIELGGPGTSYGDASFRYLDYIPGEHTNTQVRVTVVHTWLITDEAGDYIGYLTLDLYES